ncbi:MAG: 3-deoxy-manno-octulosonate-8-phosphatase KdsC [Gammaproteobacteria bacterium]|nr:MAG: 3-deoxy-manno-octulosonate-8-phosphatase KdsC [Gammaproteobacteria bacterium]
MQDIIEKAREIRMVIFDVDGVLTDGSLFVGDDGQEYKAFNSKDGHGMRMLQEAGVEIAILTGRTSNVVRLRMEELGIERVMQGHRAKLPAFEALLSDCGLPPRQIAYVGDDVVDLPVMTRVGLAIAVADAHALVKRHAHWITASPGGRGAAREVCELVLEARGQLEPLLERYLA